jgi:hypothetical protein
MYAQMSHNVQRDLFSIKQSPLFPKSIYILGDIFKYMGMSSVVSQYVFTLAKGL